MKTLIEFLKEEEENEIWLLIPSGLVSGNLPIHPSGFENATVITLTDALFYSGDIAINILSAAIPLNQICGWGSGVPTFIDKDE